MRTRVSRRNVGSLALARVVAAASVTLSLLLSIDRLAPASAAPSAAVSPSPPAKSAQAHLALDDAMPDFFATWDTDGAKPLAERVSAFRSKVIARHPGLFVRVGSLSDDDIGAYLTKVAPDIDSMRALAASMTARVGAEVDRFRARYPDFVPSATLQLLPSLYHFNGQIRISPSGAFGIAFGIDTLARENSSEAQLGLEIDHELFHVYHGERLIAVGADRFEEGIPIWFETWAEGLAAYASAEMNPPLTEREALGADLAAATPKVRSSLACLIEVHLDGVDPKDGLQLFTGGSSPPGLPARGAYLVGYLIAEHLAKSSSLAALASLHDAELRADVARDVHTQCDR
jgi:hypothetical protein